MRAWLAALGALAAACASTAVAPRTDAKVTVEDIDEQGLWRLAAEAQGTIDRSGRLYGDADVDAYLEEVGHRLEPPAVYAAIPFRLRAIRDRTPNAFCLPNGAIYVNTGMLSLLETEAELAAVLGHEMSHAVYRHALRHLHDAQNTGAFLNAISSWTGAAAQSGGLIFMASVAGYSRDLEREADREGIARVAVAGYDAREAPRFFERMSKWVEAEKVPEGSSFYASHPRLQERIESTQALTASASPGESGRERYARRTAGVLLETARVELAAGRFPQARAKAERYLAVHPDGAPGHLALGEIARREGGAGSEDAAIASYRKAVELDPRTAPAWRGLGLLLARRGDKAGAREALSRYLELAPDAPDREHVRASLKGLGGSP